MSNILEGKISMCPNSNCGFRCCEFQQSNYIVLYPGEGEGKNLDHLTITDSDYHGGQKAVCTAKDTSTCDGGYKPLDCASYPFFPKLEKKNTSVSTFVKGSKCPLKIENIGHHLKWVENAWNLLLKKNPTIQSWLTKVSLIGYEDVD